MFCAVAAVAAGGVGEHRVALVDPDARLLRSVVIALSAWDIEVVSAAEPSPGSSVPEAQQKAAAIARSEQAKVVVWVSRSDAAAVLWIYDAETTHLASRVLGVRPPFDEPDAAAVALSLKALLRSSTVAPEVERYGAASRTAAPSVLWVEGQAGGRLYPGAIEPRGALGLSVWPREMQEHLGFGLIASVGPGLPVVSPSIDGHFTDIAMSPSLRTRIRVGPRWLFEPALGATIHFTSLQGTAGTEEAPILSRRLDGSIDAALAFEFRLGSIRVGALAHAGYWPRYGRYLVRREPVLSLMPLVMDLALRVGVGIL